MLLITCNVVYMHVGTLAILDTTNHWDCVTLHTLAYDNYVFIMYLAM